MVAVPLASACQNAPQVLAIAPARQAQQVPSNLEVTIRFDHDMDQASVAARFQVVPRTAGNLLWDSPRQLRFRHQPFLPDTDYRVSLEAGYRDSAGNANSYNHGWTFHTEVAPELSGSTPGPGEQNVDPAQLLALSFTRAMDLQSLESATSITPAVRFVLRADPSDPRRTLVAPMTLLDPQTVYSVTVTRDARDVDGNPLRAGVVRDFSTGPERPLRHWVTFLADQSATAAGIWMVDGNRLPRQLAALDAAAFQWSLDGSQLLVETRAGPWIDIEIGGGSTTLPFQGTWAGFLAPGRGYLFLSAGRLQRYTPQGEVVLVDTGVGEVAVGPNGERVAYTVAGPGGDQVRGYEVDLRSRYRIQAESGAVSDLAWSPDGNRLAYRLEAGDATRSQIRVRELSGAGGLTTVRTADVASLAWQADSRHLIVGATVATSSGPAARAFRLNLADASLRPLAVEEALPAGPLLDVRSPVPSPDGHQVAFVGSGSGPGGPQVWVVNVDGTGLVPLTSFDVAGFPYSVRAPAWTVS
ncbi:MAG TPA: Ig-like domain-containing protein [Candidatus Dormibacteraeota bacterium]